MPLFKTNETTLYAEEIRPDEAEAQTASTMDRVLFLVRGLPSDGKTTLAAMIADEAFETSDYYKGKPESSFSQEERRQARGECINRTREAMERGVPRIGVADEFISEAELVPFMNLATHNGYSVFPIVLENRRETTKGDAIEKAVLKEKASKFRIKLC